MVYKAVNTMDSMVGYRNERYRWFGTAAARLDDVLNWIPARLSGLMMCLAAALLPGWTVRTELLWGSPGPEIVYYARERGFDALVMTRSSRGPLQKLGSVATYVVRNAQFLDLIIMREAAP